MAGIDVRLGRGKRALRIVKEPDDIIVSLDFASVATCASTRRCSQPHALTMCSDDLPLARSNERRRTLPSMATTPWHCRENLEVKRWNDAWNWSGSSWRNRRLNVSWLGGPLASRRKPRRNFSFSRANRAMSTAPWPPHTARRTTRS